MAGFGDVFAAGVLGAIGGAGQGMAENALMEQKAEIERLKEERLSKLRMGEHQANATFDQSIKDKAQAAQEAKVGGFFKDTNAPTKDTPYTDTTGSAEDEAAAGQNTSPAPSDMEQATYSYHKALETGNKGIIDEARARLKDVESNAEKKTDNERADAQLDLSRRRTDAEEAKADAYIKKTLSPDGKETDPAKVREVKWLADNVFGGDVKKATDMAYGIKDEPRERAIARWAGILKNDYSDSGSNKDVVQRATEIVDKFRAKDGEERKSAGPSNRASGTIQKAPDVAKPTSKAQYDALPSGAPWIDPRDGKTYRKP